MEDTSGSGDARPGSATYLCCPTQLQKIDLSPWPYGASQLLVAARSAQFVRLDALRRILPPRRMLAHRDGLPPGQRPALQATPGGVRKEERGKRKVRTENAASAALSFLLPHSSFLRANQSLVAARSAQFVRLDALRRILPPRRMLAHRDGLSASQRPTCALPCARDAVPTAVYYPPNSSQLHAPRRVTRARDSKQKASKPYDWTRPIFPLRIFRTTSSLSICCPKHILRDGPRLRSS
jgi:hypothetical protein